MTSHARLLATVLFLALVTFACGKQEEQRPVATQPASPTPGVAATEAPPVASTPAATTKPLPPPAASSAKAPAITQAPAPLPPAAAISAPPATTNPATPATTQPAAAARNAPQRPKGKITLPAKLGAVTFDHEKHAGRPDIACTTCHHASRQQKPMAAENQACRDCHTTPPVPPMKTSLQAAFHDPKGATGTCIECHRQKDESAPVKCLECHKKK